MVGSVSMRASCFNSGSSSKEMSFKPHFNGARETSKFERGVQGMRAKDLAIQRELQNAGRNRCDIRGYGVVASLCSRYMEAEHRGFVRNGRGSPRVDRPAEGTTSKAQPLRHRAVTKKLLKQAIEGKDFAMLRVIIRMSPGIKDYLTDTDEKGDTLLHDCCEKGNLRLLTVLVEIGLNVNTRGAQKRTPLHLASLRNNTPIVSLLLNSCADVFAKDSEGSRPADLCTDLKVRSMLLTRMSSRSRSFKSKRSRPNFSVSNIALDLSRTDSGIVLDSYTADEYFNRKAKWKQPTSPNKLLASLRDFKFSKETLV